MRKVLELVLACAVLVASLAAGTATAAGGTQTNVEYAPTRLVVRFKSELRIRTSRDASGTVTTGLANVDRLHKSYGVERQRALLPQTVHTGDHPVLSNVFILKVAEGTDILQMQKDYETQPEVEYAEPDYVVEMLDSPDDPYYDHQWGLHNQGQMHYHMVQRAVSYTHLRAHET